MPLAIPCRNHEARIVAKLLVDHVFSVFGVPLQLLSDKGAEFESLLMRELCCRLGIDKIRTTSYKPSTNGGCERFHRSLHSMIGKVVSKNQREWDLHIPFILAAYRALVHESTGYSPNYLMFGRETRALLELVVEFPEREEEALLTTDEVVEARMERWQDAYTLARETMGRAANRMKQGYDMRVRPAVYHAGDLVWIYSPRKFVGISAKWSRSYDGPFEILEVLSAVNVLVWKNPQSSSFVVHIDKLKSFKPTLPGTDHQRRLDSNGDRQDRSNADPATFLSDNLLLDPQSMSNILSLPRNSPEQRLDVGINGNGRGECSVGGDKNNGNTNYTTLSEIRPRRIIKRPNRYCVRIVNDNSFSPNNVMGFCNVIYNGCRFDPAIKNPDMAEEQLALKKKRAKIAANAPRDAANYQFICPGCLKRMQQRQGRRDHIKSMHKDIQELLDCFGEDKDKVEEKITELLKAKGYIDPIPRPKGKRISSMERGEGGSEKSGSMADVTDVSDDMPSAYGVQQSGQ